MLARSFTAAMVAGEIIAYFAALAFAGFTGATGEAR